MENSNDCMKYILYSELDFPNSYRFQIKEWTQWNCSFEHWNLIQNERVLSLISDFLRLLRCITNNILYIVYVYRLRHYICETSYVYSDCMQKGKKNKWFLCSSCLSLMICSALKTTKNLWHFGIDAARQMNAPFSTSRDT